MRKILVPVDGSEHALEAVRHVAALVRDGERSEIHLVNVQPPLSGDVAAFVSHRAIRDFHLDEAKHATQDACDLLDRAGIAYALHVFVGHAAPVIAECAHDLNCNLVVMGTHAFGPIANLLLGSVSRETVHLIDPDIPVTLVKAHHKERRQSSMNLASHPVRLERARYPKIEERERTPCSTSSARPA
jgi:nucleotide-binding universal stress UspA family protein